MSTKEAYYIFSLLLNKNSERKNINIDIENFVILYNREAKRWLNEFIEKNNSSDNINTIAELRVNNYRLNKISSDKSQTIYELPNNYFSLVSGDCYSLVKKGNCFNKIYNQIKKPNEINSVLEDKFLKPSFKWERGVGSLGSKGITIYKNDFDIIDTFVSYYNNPPEIDSEGYIKEDGTFSINKNPEISDYLVNQIIDKVVVEVNREFENQLGFQLAETRKEV